MVVFWSKTELVGQFRVFSFIVRLLMTIYLCFFFIKNNCNLCHANHEKGAKGLSRKLWVWDRF